MRSVIDCVTLKGLLKHDAIAAERTTTANATVSLKDALRTVKMRWSIITAS